MIKKIFVQDENNKYSLDQKGDMYVNNEVSVTYTDGKVFLRSKNERIKRIFITFDAEFSGNTLILCDAWERSYGDLQWKRANGGFIAPWYFMAYENGITQCFGVKTQPNAICYWKYENNTLTLICDVRCGSNGVRVDGEMFVAETVFESFEGDAFGAGQKFCHAMCDNAIFPPAPVYGGNDWYCNYGSSNYEKIIEHTKIIAECSEGLENRPYMVIDGGWQMCFAGQFSNVEIFNGGPWKYCNSKFRDMQKLAEEMQSMGVKPGIWFRPLITAEYIPDEYYIKDKNGNKFEDDYVVRNKFHRTMDPSRPEILEKIADDVKTFVEWGYKLIKFDFSTYDIMRRMGMNWQEDFTEDDWTFYDDTKTTAMVMKDLYRTIKEAAGDSAVIIGCNTVGHLGAGLFEMQRTGGDTSGFEWARTRKMGVNTLAFRMIQHGNFYHVDADCVGIRRDIDWKQNKEWLDLLSVSGTPMFASVASDAYTDEVREALTEAFKKASVNTIPAKPADWFDTISPGKWETVYGRKTFNWFMGDR